MRTHRASCEQAVTDQLLLGDLDMHLIAQGRHRQLADCLGAHVVTLQGVAGTRFAVWAPNARRVAVVGDFNEWDGRKHPMRLRRDCGVWEVFVPGVRAASLYKFELQDTYGEDRKSTRLNSSH